MKITREGYIGTCIMPNGEIKRTTTYPRCDKDYAERVLEQLKKNGTIINYELKWERIEVEIEPAIISQ